MPTRLEDFSREDLIDMIDDLEELIVELKDQLALAEMNAPNAAWRNDLIEELKSYLDWRKHPNTSLSKDTREAVERTMVEILHKRIQEAP